MSFALFRRVSRLPVTLGVTAAVVLIMLLLPGPASGFQVAVGLDDGVTDFAVGNKVLFTATITFDALDEVLEATVTADLTGPTGSGFTRTLPGIPIGPVDGDQPVAFGPILSASPNADTSLSGQIGHVSVLSGFAGTGYGYGYKATAVGATITITGTLTLPSTAPAGTHTLKFTVDNGAGPGSPASAELTFTVLDSLAHTLPAGWTTFSIPIRVSNSKFFTTAGQGTGGQDGLVDPTNVVIAFKFDAPSQKFKQIVTSVTDATTQIANTVALQPLEVVLVKSSVSHDATSIFLTSITNPPSTTLSAKWNAISLAVPLGTTTKSVDQALISAFTNPAGQVGYSVVVSPSINTDSFVWTRGESPVPILTRSRGYWVFMENADELAGFSSTPVKP